MEKKPKTPEKPEKLENKKTLMSVKISQEVAEGIRSFSRELGEERGIGLTRIFNEWRVLKLKEELGGTNTSIGVEKGRREEISDVLEGVKTELRRIQTFGSQELSETGERFEREVEKLAKVAQIQVAWLNEYEERLQHSHDMVFKATIAFNELLPSVENFSNEVKNLRESFTSLEIDNKQLLNKHIENTGITLTKVIDETSTAFKKNSETIKGAQERVVNECQELKTQLTNHKELSDIEWRERNTKLSKIFESIQAEIQEIKIRIWKYIGIPFGILLFLTSTIWFIRPVIEKYRSDTFVEQNIIPVVKESTKNIIANQNNFLEELKKENAAKLDELFLNEGKRVEELVKKYREQVIKTELERTALKGTSEKYEKDIKRANETIQELRMLNQDLTVKFKGEWTQWDSFKDGIAWTIFLIITATIAGYLFGKNG